MSQQQQCVGSRGRTALENVGEAGEILADAGTIVLGTGLLGRCEVKGVGRLGLNQSQGCGSGTIEHSKIDPAVPAAPLAGDNALRKLRVQRPGKTVANSVFRFAGQS
ncbi:hypothetical protein [Streptomyces sp. NBC_00557]|uniref:hypothetical protein n=1 Tax=Streptomyces sp. NBC_00557 TaxID=2975776 RepID=UPI002E820027|nr:hypothetical protein [Streptomyces sp. NBC_00557]WUC39518.1 hypothetical protein OG956_37625 [Streptomyces sp. NBC_00557]